MYRKLYVDRCVDIVCNAVKVQSPLTLEQLCQIIQENLPGSCVPKDNLKEDARLVILDDSSFTIEYANTVPETKLLFSIAHEISLPGYRCRRRRVSCGRQRLILKPGWMH